MIETLDVRTLLLILILGHAIAALLLFFATLKRVQIYDTVFMISMAFQAAGWKYPALTCARITVGNREYSPARSLRLPVSQSPRKEIRERGPDSR